jgi:hypothetical protein
LASAAPSPPPSALRHSQHRLAEIQTCDGRAASSQGEGNVAGPAAHIERLFTGSRIGHPDKPALPHAVQPEALQIVHEIITPGHRGEKIAHLRGPRLARVVKLIRHPGNLRLRLGNPQP